MTRGPAPLLTEEEVRSALVLAKGSVKNARALLVARGVDVSERTVYRAMDRYGIKVERVVKAA